MVDETIEQAKAALRVQAHDRRAALGAVERAEAAEAACGQFFASFPLQPGNAVAAYWCIRDELDCRPILLELMDKGFIVILPAVIGAGEPLDLRVWEPGAALYEAGFGTLAPSPLAPRAEPDVILMPLLGFDRFGTRLGYGGGYYDRTLASLTRKSQLIGLAFSVQELPMIPRQDHDVPLDAVVTEAGVRHFGLAA